MQITQTVTRTTTSPRKLRSSALDPQMADRLLDLLSSDDAFRRLFKRNPAQALEQVGFSKETGMPSPSDCFFGIDKLASKTQIAQARAQIKAMLTKGLSQTTPQLDARNNGQRQTLR